MFWHELDYEAGKVFLKPAVLRDQFWDAQVEQRGDEIHVWLDIYQSCVHATSRRTRLQHEPVNRRSATVLRHLLQG